YVSIMILDEVLSTRTRVRVIRALSVHPDHWFSVSELAEDVGLHRVPTSRSIDELEEIGAVECERKGRVRLCRINTTNRFVRSLLIPLFVNEHLSVDKALEEFIQALDPHDHPAIRAVLLYGSASTGRMSFNSDLDVLVVVDEITDNVETAVMDACSTILETGVVVMADIITAKELHRLKDREEAFYRTLHGSHRCIYGASLAEVTV
ncbi:MAG: nucleotidyltransferase domain-containing protein, partial [Methanopyri archaeon]|nr:nucleotidyltransferase domain-containing protein [Methanopyri archaeon]